VAILFRRDRGLAHSVLEHAIVTGLLVAGLTVFEWVRQSYPGEFQKYPFVFYAVALAFVFTVIVFGIYNVSRYFESRLEAAMRGQPIPVRRLGVVDGIWLEVIWDGRTKRRAEVSIVKIESTAGEGFSLWGRSYDDDHISEVGHFAGTGYLRGDADLVYHYEGAGSIGTNDKGVGYCTFQQDPIHPDEAKFDGAFLKLGGNTHRYFHGRKVGQNEIHRLEGSGRKAFLLEFLQGYAKELG
jgi:hypothetical protein